MHALHTDTLTPTTPLGNLHEPTGQYRPDNEGKRLFRGKRVDSGGRQRTRRHRECSDGRRWQQSHHFDLDPSVFSAIGRQECGKKNKCHRGNLEVLANQDTKPLSRILSSHSLVAFSCILSHFLRSLQVTQDVVAALKDRHAQWQQEDAARKTGAAGTAKSALPPPPPMMSGLEEGQI